MARKRGSSTSGLIHGGIGSRGAANARERARMRVLSRAFSRLKTSLPWVPADTKLSKLDTLRLAASYITHLRATLLQQPSPNPLPLSWPFALQQSSTTQNQNYETVTRESDQETTPVPDDEEDDDDNDNQHFTDNYENDHNNYNSNNHDFLPFKTIFVL